MGLLRWVGLIGFWFGRLNNLGCSRLYKLLKIQIKWVNYGKRKSNERRCKERKFANFV
jgi:hypothetical protein